MTNEEAIKWLKVEALYIEEDIGHGKEILEAYDMAIKALEQEPCEDCISREETLKAFAEKCGGECGCCMYNGSGYDTAENCKLIKSMPSVTPQPKIDRWEWVQYDSNPNIGNWHCSECRTIIPHMPEETDNAPIYKWCPMCGARMEVEE